MPPIEAGQRLRVESEVMRVLAVAPLGQMKSQVMLLRGVQGTAATAHLVNTPLAYGPPEDFATSRGSAATTPKRDSVSYIVSGDIEPPPAGVDRVVFLNDGPL